MRFCKATVHVHVQPCLLNVSCLGGESSIAPPFITTLPQYQPQCQDLILMARSDTTLLTRDTVKLPEQRRRDT